MFINSISRLTNYAMTSTDQMIKKIVSNPFAVSTVLKLSRNIFAGFDLYYAGKVRQRGITDAMHGALQLAEFYTTYRNMMYWINLFSKDSIDKELLTKTLQSSMSVAEKKGIRPAKDNALAENVLTEVYSREAYHSKDEVYQAISASLEKNGYTSANAQKIAKEVTIQQKQRSLVQLIYMTCFTVTDLADNFFTLKRWQMIELSDVAASIGCRSKACKYIFSLSVGQVLGSIASVGLIFAVGNSTYRTINERFKYSKAKDENEKKESYQELRNAVIDLVSGGIDLGTTAAPLFYAFNPPALLALDLISNGMGLVYFMVR